MQDEGRSVREIGHSIGRCLVVLASAWMVYTGPCRASSGTEEASERFEKGVKLYKSGDYTAALVEFKAAYAAEPHYAVKYNIGVTLYHLHRYSEARVQLEGFLAEAGDAIEPERRTEVEQLLDELSGLVSTVTFTCNAPRAKLFLNGKYTAVVEGELELILDVGEYDVEIRAEHHETFYDRIDVAGAQDIVLDAEMTPLETGEPEQGPEEQPEVFVVEKVVEIPPEPAEEPVVKPPSTAPFWVFFSLTMTSLVLTALPTGFFFKNRDEYQKREFEDRAEMEHERQELVALARTADILWGVTGALAIATVISGAVIFHKRKKLAKQNLSLLTSPAGLCLRGTF
jgi:tetratricopeptide (TPR) repeat protein